MSIRAIQAVWDRSKVGGSMRLLLLALADFADEEGYSWPSVETLSHRCGRTERHTRRLITLAIGKGELRAAREGGASSSRYWLTPGGQPVEGRTSMSPLPGHVRPPGGDTHVPRGGTPTSPEPSMNRQGNHQLTGADGIWNGKGGHDGRHGKDCVVCFPVKAQT